MAHPCALAQVVSAKTYCPPCTDFHKSDRKVNKMCQLKRSMQKEKPQGRHLSDNSSGIKRILAHSQLEVLLCEWRHYAIHLIPSPSVPAWNSQHSVAHWFYCLSTGGESVTLNVRGRLELQKLFKVIGPCHANSFKSTAEKRLHGSCTPFHLKTVIL